MIFDKLKFSEKGVEKKFIHVRINIGGSPLECPGLFLFMCSACLFLSFEFAFVVFVLNDFLMIEFKIFLETFPSIGRVRVKHHGILLTLKGTVIRSGSTKMYEGERTYMCKKCKHM